MATRRKDIEVTYWPVGQGLFTLAEFWCERTAIRIVYDCGSLDWGKSGAEAYIEALRGRFVDILVISHLHEDHISGIPDLLAACRGIGRVWLPYMAPKLRMLYALDLALSAAARGIAPPGFRDIFDLVTRPEDWFRERGVSVVQMGRGRAMPSDEERSDTEQHMAVSLRPWPSAFRRRSGWHAFEAILKQAQQPLLTLATWVKPLTREKTDRICEELGDCLDATSRSIFGKLTAPKRRGFPQSEVVGLAEAITASSPRSVLTSLYKIVHSDRNHTSLFLLLEGMDVNEGPWFGVFAHGCQQSCRLETLMDNEGWKGSMPTILWSGDAPGVLLEMLLEDAADPLRTRLAQVNFHQVPHHGARSSFLPEFYDALGGAAGFISCGTRNTFGHPSPVVVQRANATVVTENSRPVVAAATWR